MSCLCCLFFDIGPQRVTQLTQQSAHCRRTKLMFPALLDVRLTAPKYGCIQALKQ
jgi:hypothetical protein